MTAEDKIQVLLADDRLVFREVLRTRLEATGRIEVIGEGEDGREAVDLALSLEPDIVVMDIKMPNMNGLQAIEQLRAMRPQLKVIVLSAHASKEYERRCRRLGVWGYVLKSAPSAELVRVVEAAHQGIRSLSE